METWRCTSLAKILVTSAWPYINYMPHLGNIVGSILSADIVARYHRLKGDHVVFVSGSDEHGTPIEVEAVRLGIPPKKLTDQYHERVADLFKKWEISFDNYTRTENPVHKEFVQNHLLKIQNNGYIFTQETELPYCPKCNRFLPDRFVEGICPHCNYEGARGDQCEECGRLLEPTKLIQPRCTICRSPPVMKKTTHWYLDLPSLTEKLYEYIKNNEQLPDNARNFSLNFLKEGLKPRAVTRNNKWGIPAPFPGSEDKTIYVWVEAVLGYVSATIEYFQKKGQKEGWREYWFDTDAKTLYFIGKDNIPFHTIILPALLLAAQEGHNLPWNVDSTEFLQFEGQKFSKSRRIGVWIDEALQLFPADYWRYVLLSIRPETKDTNFTWRIFVEKVNSDLNDTLGNFIHRTLSFINQYFDSSVPKPNKLDEYDKRILRLAKKRAEKIAQNIEEFKLQAALRAAMGLSRLGNKYLNKKEPWNTIKTNPQASANAFYVAMQIVKVLAIILEPFTPLTVEKLWGLLNLLGNVHEQKWGEATTPIQSGHKINKAEPLFHKILVTEKELQTLLEETRSKAV
ncbi:MAG: methionine--tRNA ligase [Candidatus Bathyarchaeota archaeon]|nr:methionine--tRNA ligase [Candidatus Bathyarchaeota archaeon]